MKKTGLLFAFLISLLFITIPDVKASHMAGGEIWYEYAGNTTYPHRYNVYLIIYRDVSGIALCSGGSCSKTVCIKSSCYPQQNITVNFDPFVLQNPGGDTSYTPSFAGAIYTPELTDCVDPNAPNLVVTEAYRFAGQVDLPGVCSDYTFSFYENARNGSTNLLTAGDFYIEAKLNNTLGPNTGPKFVNPAAKSFCVGSAFTWSQAAIEPDGDSLYYDFGNPLAGTCGSTPNAIAFSPGYSVSQPMTTTGPIFFDHGNGTLKFTPAQVEVVTINITIKEYRWSSTFGWLQNGSSVRDLQIPVVNLCNPDVNAGPKFNTSSYGTTSVSADSLKGYGFPSFSNDSLPNSSGGYSYEIPIIDYNCYDSIVNITFEKGVYCETIAPDGTDFRLVGPDTIARPIVGVIDKCKPDLTTKDIDLLLHKPLDVNGDYFLYVKVGNDGNTLTNKCGFPLDEFFLIIIRVEDCPILDYALENVSVENDKNVEINWTVDPTSFSQKLFTTWNILRANDNDQFYPIDNVNDVNARSYIDTSLDYGAVDNVRFQYAVQLVENFTYRAPTNNIRTILLTSELNNDTTGFDLEWTEYDGWDSAAYEVFWGEKDTTTNTISNWYNYDGPNENFFGTDYILPTGDYLNADTAGIYAFKVEATEPGNPSNNYSSESNWIYIQIDHEEPPKIPPFEIPNVFTPNSDGVNDVFNLAFAEEGLYQNVSVTIYNRNGRMVFEQDQFFNDAVWNGQDMNSGQKVADGVYYYVIHLTDRDGKTEQKTGQLSVFARGTN